jgi:DNA-binding GntR family transcriptional regulator
MAMPRTGRQTSGEQDQKKRGRPKGTGALAVYEALRARILDLTLAPGADIEEAGLVAEFGLSRTPVREALIRLASDGLVTVLANRGARVAGLNFAELPQYFEALDLTQRAVTRWAALRAGADDVSRLRAAGKAFDAAVEAGDVLGMIERNRDFHVLIAEACGNIHLAQTYYRLLDEGLRLARLSYAYETPSGDHRARHIVRTVDEHGDMVAAIEAKDGDRAEKLAALHAAHFRERMMMYLGQDSSAEVAIVSAAG